MNQLFAHSFVQPDWSTDRSSSLAAPVDVFENIATHSSNGLLMITVPLHESNRPKRIRVTASEPKSVAVEAGKR
jgi:hypothetical protein